MEKKLLWVSLSLSSFIFIFVIISVYGVPNLYHLILMDVLFGLAMISLYLAFRNFKLSKWKWFVYGLGYVIACITISQLTIHFNEVFSVIIAGLTWLVVVSVAEILKTKKTTYG